MPSITRNVVRQPILTAKAANGVGTPMLVSDYKNILIDLSTTGTATLTVKIQASLNGPTDPPTFGSAASSTNKWFYIHSYDLVNPSTGVVGSTGYVVAGTDIVKGVLVNTDGIQWLNCEVSGRSAGSATAIAVNYDNQ
jgi:hypothetical protein